MHTQKLAQDILSGNKTALARGITLVESTNEAHKSDAQELISACLNHGNESVRIGITGVPGVGKSTFIEALGTLLTQKGEKVAVLAVDPTSTLSKGSILGDKTRMQELAKDSNAFIRPSPSGAALGGVARRTKESILLCEAAGYNIILIETVGVGQSETMVHGMVDFFLLLKLAGAGDELQGIKRGIVEMADAIVINKAEGKNANFAKQAQAEFSRALHMYPPKSNGWIPKVLSCSALENIGISEVWKLIEAYITTSKENQHFYQNRKHQNKNWMLQTVSGELKYWLEEHATIKEAKESIIKKVDNNETSPFKAADELLAFYKEQFK